MGIVLKAIKSIDHIEEYFNTSLSKIEKNYLQINYTMYVHF